MKGDIYIFFDLYSTDGIKMICGGKTMRKILKRTLACALAVVMVLCAMPVSGEVLTAEAAGIPSDAVEFNGHYYKVYDGDTSWEEAKSNCENLGGHLVTITSEEEYEFIRNLLDMHTNGGNHWMGAIFNDTLQQWTWCTGENWTFSYWIDWLVGSEKVGALFTGDLGFGKLSGLWHTSGRNLNFKPFGVTYYLYTGFICEWEPHQWYFDIGKTALACSHCNEIYYLSSNKNFKYGRDNFSFPHKDIGSYDISEIGMKYMDPSLKLDIFALGINKLSQGLNYIKNKIDNNDYGFWGGSCYGIACMDASFLSTISTSNYGSSSVYGLSLDTKLKDSINIMMYSQASVFSIGNQIGNTFSNKNKAAVSAAKSMTSNGYLPVLCYTGHAVNIIGILPDDYDPNYYVLSIYDCNSVDEPRFIIISKDYKKAYLGKFDLNNINAPITISSNEIEIVRVLTGSLNSINLWAPGLSTSSLYSPARSKAMYASSGLSKSSQDDELQTLSKDYIRFLLASDGELVVTADDDTSFTYNNGEITDTNIAEIYCEELGDFGVTKVVIPCTASTYKIDSDYQYYTNISYDDKTSVFYCEKGGISTFECEGIASVDTRSTKSYSEISCYKYDMIADSDTVGLLINNSSSNTKIDFTNDNPIVESGNIEDINIKVQHNDEELSIEDIVFTSSNNVEQIIIKSENGNIVADYEHSHTDQDADGKCDICGETLEAVKSCPHICHKTGFSAFIWMILRVFCKLFGINQTCSCGVKHY